MAPIDDLIGLVEDTALHRELQAATAELKRHRRFGLVFEEHIPETTAPLGYPLRLGATFQRRDDPAARNFYRVLDVQGEAVSIVSLEGKDSAQTCPAAEVMVVQRLGEPFSLALPRLGRSCAEVIAPTML
jgi:adenine-specific DNA-methyltransferase